ncbi:MAG: hypothetical protein ACOYOQ_00405 [Microthrixaceae bacterium]
MDKPEPLDLLWDGPEPPPRCGTCDDFGSLLTGDEPGDVRRCPDCNPPADA